MVEELFEYLRQIHALLEQIYTITDNQTTILLASADGGETYGDENEALDMITQMMDYKEELTEELFGVEDSFQQQYDKCKPFLSQDEDVVAELKGLVAAVFERKEAIVEREQSNLLLLQALSKRKMETVHMPQNPKEVSAAYQKQQKKT